MQVKIGNKVYDSDKEPIALIFLNDESRKVHARHLLDMEPKATVRVYCVCPEDMTNEEVVKFMEVEPEDC